MIYLLLTILLRRLARRAGARAPSPDPHGPSDDGFAE